MKNLSLTILIFLTPFFLQADNWELFPFNQKTYYYFQTDDIETIAPYYMDFEEVEDGNVLQYPLRTYIESLGVCYPPTPFQTAVPVLNDIYFKSSDNGKLYAYIHKPYYSSFDVPSNIEELQDTLFFYPQSSVGDSWEIHTQSFDQEEFPFSHLVVTCTSTAFEEIVENMEDSIKTFRVQAFEGENMVNSDFDEVVMKLSKQYGLLEWTPFVEWFNYDLKTHASIAGFEDSSGTVVGERTPLVTDFFPYEVGDSFTEQKRSREIDKIYIERYKNTITEVNRTDTSIVYTSNREIFKTTIDANSNDTLDTSYTPIHTKSATQHYFPQHIIDLAYWDLGIGEIREEFDESLSADVEIIHLIKLENDDCGTFYQLSIEDVPCSFGTYTSDEVKICDIICLPSDCEFCTNKIYQTNLGIISTHLSAYWKIDLIEASIGDCYFTNIESPTYFASQITLHPNPTTNRFVLRLQNPKQALQNLQLKITDIHGRTLQQMPLSQSSIEVDLSQQPNGIYLVQISDGESWWTDKVVKY